MPTCGLYCSTAIGCKKQRIKLQCMIPIKIGDRVIEIIFLVIPNLISDLIIGCDFLIEWEASIDFERCVLLIKD
jgi:Retroviral aspartyl protease.